MQDHSRIITALLGSVISLSALCACSRTVPGMAAGESRFRLAASVQELMEGHIDPAADALWDSVAFIASTTGTEDRQPRSEAEWLAVRTQAVNLIEAANLLIMPGRRLDPKSTPVGLGELPPAEIQRRIDAGHDNFVQFARVLQDAAAGALAAIDARNAQKLMDAGGVIDAACEACHVTYWYPNQDRSGS